MRKILIVFVSLLFLSSCKTGWFTGKSVKFNKEATRQITDLNERLVQYYSKENYWMEGTELKDEIWKDYLLPSYLSNNNVDFAIGTVNAYLVAEFEIEEIREPLVTYLIINRENTWAHRVTVKMKWENGKLYVVPVSYRTNDLGTYLDVFTEEERYIDFDF